jgi:hypothetical protein
LLLGNDITSLGRVGTAAVGRQLIADSLPTFLQPDPESISRLAELHRAIRQLAAAALNTFSHVEVTRSLEEELKLAM